MNSYNKPDKKFLFITTSCLSITCVILISLLMNYVHELHLRWRLLYQNITSFLSNYEVIIMFLIIASTKEVTMTAKS